uniref:Cysteine proteinase inhibitor n=1 Tax=Aegilops tauschii TaxID=37682 RepID=M8C1U1_AEGTA
MLAAVRERAEAEDAARFAVAEHNRKQGSALEFTRVVNAKRQVVAGTLHDLMVEVVDSGKKSMYKAKVWVKPWQNFKAVVEFRHAGDFQYESSVASDVSTGQAILKLSLQTDMAPKMHSNENTGLSVDSSSSQGKTAYKRPKVVGPFHGPCASGNYVHQAAPIFKMLVPWRSGK